MIQPNKILCMLGGGQLGRFFVMSAHRMGYKVAVLDPDKNSPAGRIADIHYCAQYDDIEILEKITKECDAATTEFENIPAQTLEFLEKKIPVYPKSKSVFIVQNRIREKTFLYENSFPVGPFKIINSDDDLVDIDHKLFPAILKTAQFGYDGKGQVLVESLALLEKAFIQLGRKECILEKKIELDYELSVILARDKNGQTATFPVAENRHVNGILDLTIAPARTAEGIQDNAKALAKQIATKLDYVGVMAVEFFVRGNEIYVNEIAPRPHNSGHYSLDSCFNSQFDMQVHVLTDSGLPSTINHSQAVMINLLGDSWLLPKPHEPQWQGLFNQQEPPLNIKLHLYGKEEPRLGRKMGHITLLGEKITEENLTKLEEIKKKL
ncbi:MAG: 5-(carboxyamino)imidazole ribonucleotide synthase [Nitrosomonadales bacterium]